MYCIREDDKPNWIRKYFSIVKLEGNQIILPIKIQAEEKLQFSKKEIKRQEKLAKKTKKIIEQSNSKKVVLSKEIKKHTIYKNELESYSISIMNGRWIFLLIIQEILEYLLEKRGLKKEETILAITVNDPNDYEMENMKLLAKQYKRIHIVTNHMQKFKKMTEDFYEEEGIMIPITNNHRKSLAKSQIILNFDFPQELFNQYQIQEEAAIVSIEEEIKIKKKRFQGIVIRDYEIKTKKEDFWEDILFLDKYKKKDIYEAQFYSKQSLEGAREKIKKDGIQIENLFLNNGKI